MNEVELLKRLQGTPHTLLFEGLWADPRTGQFFLVTEFCAGGELCVSDCPFEEVQVAGLIVQLTEALAAMNKNHIVHRDLKPQVGPLRTRAHAPASYSLIIWRRGYPHSFTSTPLAPST